jgi:putative MATE family efflux protein
MLETKDEVTTTAEPPAKKSKAPAQVERLGTAKISKLMVEFAIPSIIGLVVNGLYNIIDSIFMGHAMEGIGLATAQIATPIMIFSMAVGVLIGAGGNALAALRLGEGKHDEAERVMGNAFSLTIIAGVLCTALVLVFIDPVLTLSGAKEDLWEPSHVFVRIISFGFVLQFFGMAFNNFIRTAGDPNRALYTMVVGTVACIILNFFFVMVFGWGVAGSAWATVIGQGVSAFMMLWYFTFSKKAPFKLRLPCLKLKRRLVTRIFMLGAAAFVLQSANAIIGILLNQQMGIYGALSGLAATPDESVTAVLAAIGVVQRIAMFTFFPILGVAMAAQPLFGYNYGASSFDRVKATFKVSFAWIMGIGIFFWILVHLFPNQIVNLFGVTGELQHFTVIVLQVQLFLIPFMGLQVISANYFQSTGQPLKSMLLSLTRQVLYLIPLLYGLPLLMPLISPSFRGVDGLYYAFPIADLLSVATATIMMVLEFKKLNAKIATSADKNASALAVEKPAINA